MPTLCRLTNVEPDESFKLFLEHVDMFDLGPSWAVVHELDEPLDGIRLSFEHRLDGTIPAIRDPTGHGALPRESAHRVTEEHALYTPAGHNTPPNHRHILPAWSSAKS